MENIYKVRTKRGERFYRSFEGANIAIEEDIADIRGNIISDTRTENGGKVIAIYQDVFPTPSKEIYEITIVPLYD